jgi:hypothetical protein
MNNDEKLFEISCKEMLMEIVKTSKTINENLTFFQKVLLYDKIREMSISEIKLLFNEASREIETKDERDLKYGAAVTAGGAIALKSLKKAKGVNRGLIGAAAGASLLFIYRKFTDPCFKQTYKILNPTKRKIAELHCRLEAIKKVITKIRYDIAKCHNASNPETCQDKLTVELNKWRDKYQEHLVSLTKLRGN